MGYISLPSVLNARVGITSYYCVILKIVILHDGKTTIQNAVFRFSLKKERNIVSFQKTKKTLFIFKQKNRWLFFLKKKQKQVALNHIYYGHESGLMTVGILSQVQAAEMGFLRRVHGVILRDKVRNCELLKT